MCNSWVKMYTWLSQMMYMFFNSLNRSSGVQVNVECLERTQYLSSQDATFFHQLKCWIEDLQNNPQTN